MVLADSHPIHTRVRQSARIEEASGLTHLQFLAMGTHCKISLVEPTRALANAYLDHALNWVADFEAKYSRFLDSSLISKINRLAGVDWVEIDPETEKLFDLCKQLHFFTQGTFDPTCLPLTHLWNWKSAPAILPDPAIVAETRARVGFMKVLFKPGAIMLPVRGMCLDLGGIGKEYAVDRIGAMADEFEVADWLVDFGQDIRVKGSPPGKPAWHLGLEDPTKPGACWGSVALKNAALASSGSYQRNFVKDGKTYGHIIDPRTGYPVQNNLLSTHVIASTCTMAGILSTTAFILGPSDGIHLIQSQMGASGALLSDKYRCITPHFYEHLVEQKPT